MNDAYDNAQRDPSHAHRFRGDSRYGIGECPQNEHRSHFDGGEICQIVETYCVCGATRRYCTAHEYLETLERDPNSNAVS